MIRSLTAVFNWKSAAQPKISLWGLASAAGTVALLCSLSGFAARLGWLPELCSHFRLQYALFLLVMAIAFALRKRLFPASMFLVGTLINLIAIGPYLLPGTGRPQEADSPDLRLLLANVQSANPDAMRLLAYIDETRPDIILVEEITPEWLARLDGLHHLYPHRVCEPRDDNFGIALFSRLELERADIVALGEAGAPSVEVELTLGAQRVLLLGTHPVPPASPFNFRFRNDQLRAVGLRIGRWAGPAILLGDLNTTPYSPHFQQLIHAARLRDTALGFKIRGTWPAAFPPLRIPLDHCLISREFNVLERRVGPPIGSDHLPLFIHLSLSSSPGTSESRVENLAR